MQNSSIKRLTKRQIDAMIEKSDWTHNGLPVITVDDVDGRYTSYAVAKGVREMDAAVASYLSENLWAYSPEAIAENTGIDHFVIEKIGGMGEESNAALRAMVDGTCGFDRLVADAVETEGYEVLPNYRDSGGIHPCGYYFYAVD